jgi:hypothetical protein
MCCSLKPLSQVEYDSCVPAAARNTYTMHYINEVIEMANKILENKKSGKALQLYAN